MVDITKCNDHECHKKENCYRYTAPETPLRQSWFAESPRQGAVCDEFLNIERNA